MSQADPDTSDRFLTAFFGDREGWACFGYKPTEVAGGRDEQVIQKWFEWPRESDRAIAWIEDMSPQHAMYWSPLLHEEPRRRKGNALHRRWLWLDLDGDPGNSDLLSRLGAIEIRSGRPGHTHHYVRLSRSLPAREWHSLARALRDAVGGAADPKIADNDFLRLPGSLNFRTVPPTLVSAR